MEQQDHNTVRLVGRVTSTGAATTLPSGDVVHTVRVTVGRPPRRGERRAGVDAVDVACWSSTTRRTASRVSLDERVEVVGSLRRRFFRTGAGVASRYEVEAGSLRRLGSRVTPARPASVP